MPKIALWVCGVAARATDMLREGSESSYFESCGRVIRPKTYSSKFHRRDDMNLFDAVVNWYGCPYGLKKCRADCDNFMKIDLRTESPKGIGPSTNGQNDLCVILENLNKQVMKKTKDPRLTM
jgi:hypothetical protein